MSTLDDLQAIQEIDKFNVLKDYIRNFILTSENLWKIIYYPTSNPLDSDYGENPYIIFEEDDIQHGVVLFKEKNDTILNSETVNLIIKFSSETSQDSNCLNTVFIEYSVILKGVNIQTLADNSSRAYKICELIDEQFNHVNVSYIGEIKRISFKNESINEENSSFKLIYKCTISNYSDEIQIYNHSQIDDIYGITRESYSLLITENPILVGIQYPQTDDKISQPFGYSIELFRLMFCNINLNITESSLIKHGDKFYRIKEILEYEDYWKCTLEVTYSVIINE